MTSQVPVITTHTDAEAFLDARIGAGVQPGLKRITGLLALMGDPQGEYATVHIAGTNGKTTVARMVQQILGAHGLATGGFTSPHLQTIEERFHLHGSPISEMQFTEAVRDIAWFVDKYEADNATTVTYFETTVALAFSLFANVAVDVAIVEVGLGGRLDATNVLDADVSVVTGIGIDHTEFLGTTIAEIAREKMAIVKDGGTLVTGPLPADAIGMGALRVDETKANWIRFGLDFSVENAAIAVGGWQCSINGVHGEYEDLYLRLHGRHQVDNLATAIAASEMLLGQRLDAESLAFAIASLTSPGRLEVVRRRPLVLLDGAHNRQGFDALAMAIQQEFPAMEWKLVIGAKGERPVADLVTPLKGLVSAVYAAASHDPAAIPSQVVADLAGSALDISAVAYASPDLALADAVSDAGPEGGVIVAGSLYLVGDIRGSFDVGSDRSPEAHVRFEAEVADEDPDAEFAESDLFD
ncbi:MAG: Mur ligase family protein [Acidimicrobiia bacterium]|nr:Mur ligase family protein [Acidimicrobiia bacterium]